MIWRQYLTVREPVKPLTSLNLSAVDKNETASVLFLSNYHSLKSMPQLRRLGGAVVVPCPKAISLIEISSAVQMLSVQ